MKKIGIAAIGVGHRLRGLLELLLRAHGDRCELLCMSDESAVAMKDTAKHLGGSIQAYADPREAIHHKGVDWVMIGSRNDRHRDHCLLAFEAGRHVFCEKPLAITVQECEDIRRAHQRAGTLFATGFVLRHAPLYVAIHDRIQAGQLGRIVSMEANENLAPDHGGYIMRNWRRHRSMSGSHLLEKCSHDIDLINWMIGDVASRAASFGGLDIFTPENVDVEKRLMQPGDEPPLFRGWPSAWEDVDPFLVEKDIEDNRVCILEYRNRTRVMFHANACTAIPQRRMYICGLEGTLEADLVTGRARLKRIGRNTVEEEIELGARGGHGGADGIIMDDLAACMTTGVAPKASGEEGFRSAITCLALDEAMLENKVVNLEPIWKRFGV